MKLFNILSVIIFLVGASQIVSAQEEVIYLKNPSFEGIPRQGGSAYYGISAPGWTDCGAITFPNETPPDIHPGGFFRVTKPPQDGRTYIGLVARENESWESVSQLLSTPMEQGNCYSVNLYLSRSDNYVNKESNDPQEVVKAQNNPLVLRIYGGLRPCEKKQLLAESELITHTEWKNYSFDFEINSNLYYITFEAFYKTPVLYPYNGNLLLDNISNITRVACPGEPPLAVVETPPANTPTPKVVTPQKDEKLQYPEDTKVPVPDIEKADVKRSQKTITEELNSEKIAAGQIIQINKLYFQADTSSINADSYASLEELYEFLRENPNMRIEIGGHTNGIPEDDYCDKLSNERAKVVAEYLIGKGIQQSRVEFKGYGKRKPIASNNTKEGRRRNQRVEITILNVN